MNDYDDYDDQPVNWQERAAQVQAPQPVRVYSGVFTEDDDWFKTTKDGGVFDPEPSLKIHNHSPDGFAWGYAGSGPTQLALALLFDVTGDKELSQHFYMDYKWDVIARLSKEAGTRWTLTSSDVITWLREKAKTADNG